MPLPVITSPHKKSVMSGESPGCEAEFVVCDAEALRAITIVPALNKNSRRYIVSVPGSIPE